MFKQFLIETEKSELNTTIQKLPKQHQSLVKSYNFSFQGNHTLKGDSEHVGELDPNKKKITVAAPWAYGREITVLHEIGHLVWEKLDEKTRNEWKKLVKNSDLKKHQKNKKALNQNEEEIFCMIYASTYARNPVTTFHNDVWINFIKNLPKLP